MKCPPAICAVYVTAFLLCNFNENKKVLKFAFIFAFLNPYPLRNVFLSWTLTTEWPSESDTTLRWYERGNVAVRFRGRNYFGWNGKSLYKGYYSHLESFLIYQELSGSQFPFIYRVSLFILLRTYVHLYARTQRKRLNLIYIFLIMVSKAAKFVRYISSDTYTNLPDGKEVK